jgi:CRISPR-associated endonuclease/helicase Cas3
MGWLDHAGSAADDLKAEASVRDVNHDTLEVLVVQKQADGLLHILPWVNPHGGDVIPHDCAPDDELAKVVASCSVNLPSVMCFESEDIDGTIDSLEREGGIEAWQDSPWLRGALILVLNNKFSAVVNGWELIYDMHTGLSYRRDGGNDESNRV